MPFDPTPIEIPVTTLPDKPSDLIEVALRDLRLVEQDPRYTINMHIWHGSGRRCAVCLAGSVMAKSLGASPLTDVVPNAYPAHTYQKLCALDSFREGWVGAGLTIMGITRQPGELRPSDRPHHEYRRGGILWWREMEKLVQDLRDCGL